MNLNIGCTMPSSQILNLIQLPTFISKRNSLKHAVKVSLMVDMKAIDYSVNLEGQSFLDIGHLWGLGLQRDTRNMVTDDFNGDGRVDCLFTHFEAWPDESQVLRIYQNQLETTSNWIGFRLSTGPKEPSPIGVID
jgi:hypothetical protein